MPTVNGKKFPYTPEGRARAKKHARDIRSKVSYDYPSMDAGGRVVNEEYQYGGPVSPGGPPGPRPGPEPRPGTPMPGLPRGYKEGGKVEKEKWEKDELPKKKKPKKKTKSWYKKAYEDAMKINKLLRKIGKYKAPAEATPDDPGYTPPKKEYDEEDV
jgi:hypothetical protein